MDKKTQIENALHTYVTDEDVAYIEEWWKAFYNEPDNFTDDVVIDMILKDIGKQPISNWNITNEVNEIGGNKTMKAILELYSNKPQVLLTKEIESRLAWGRYDETEIYIRQTPEVEKTLTPFMQVPQTITGYQGRQLFITAESTESRITIVMNECNNDSIEVSSIIPDGYMAIYYGTFDMSTISLYVETFVAFNRTGAKGRTPILWAGSDLPTSKAMPNGTEWYRDIILNAKDFSLDQFAPLFKELKSTFQPISEENGNADEDRYVTLKLTAENETVSIGYNRNHVAYNGNTDYLKALGPVVLRWLLECKDEIEDTNYFDYLLGKIDSDMVYVKFIGREQPEESTVVNEDIQLTHFPKRPLHENKMVRAAQKGFFDNL